MITSLNFAVFFVNLYTSVLHQETCRAEIIIVAKAIQCLALDLSLCLKLSLNWKHFLTESLVSGIRKGSFSTAFHLLWKPCGSSSKLLLTFSRCLPLRNTNRWDLQDCALPAKENVRERYFGHVVNCLVVWFKTLLLSEPISCFRFIWVPVCSTKKKRCLLTMFPDFA